MTFEIPFRWRRGLVAALRRWAGTAVVAVARWQRSRTDVAGVRVCVAVAAPAAPAAPGEAVRDELDAAHRRIASAQAFGALAEAARRGGEVLARLEDGSDPPRPAVVVLCTELPARSLPASKLGLRPAVGGLAASSARVAVRRAGRAVLQHGSDARDGVRSYRVRSEQRERRRP